MNHDKSLSIYKFILLLGHCRVHLLVNVSCQDLLWSPLPSINLPQSPKMRRPLLLVGVCPAHLTPSPWWLTPASLPVPGRTRLLFSCLEEERRPLWPLPCNLDSSQHHTFNTDLEPHQVLNSVYVIYLIFVCVPSSLPSSLHLVPPKFPSTFTFLNKYNQTKVNKHFVFGLYKSAAWMIRC